MLFNIIWTEKTLKQTIIMKKNQNYHWQKNNMAIGIYETLAVKT